MTQNLKSKQLQSQTALRESETRYRQMFETNQAVKLIINPTDGRIVEANQAAVRFYGYDISTLTQMRITDINMLSEPEVKQEMERARQTERLFFNFRHRLASGEIRDVEVYSGPVKTPQGELLYSIIHDVTALREQKERLELALEGADLGMWDWHAPSGKMIFNERWAEMLGYTLAEIEPKMSSWENLLHPDDAPAVMAALTDHLKGRTPVYQTEYRLRAKSGEWKWILGSGKVFVRDDQGNPLRVAGIHQDITSRKEAELLLQLQHTLTLAISATSDIVEAFNLVLFAVFQIEGIDCGGGYLVNERTGALDLIAHQGLSPQFIEAATHYPADAPQTKLIMAGRPLYGHYDAIAPADGEAKHHEGLRALVVIPMLHDGQVIAVLNLASHTQDVITANARYALEMIASQIGSVIARIRAEMAQQESRQNLQTLFDTVEDFLFILDANGNIIRTNPVVQKQLGYSAEELVGVNVLGVHPPNRREEAEAIVAAMLTGETTVCPVPLITKEGQLIPVETKVVQGKWSGQDVLFGISRDITERQQAEQALRQSHHKLEAALTELKETQRKMIQQERLAAVGQLVAGIAHDFNNILTGILGFTELLQLSPDTPAVMQPELQQITDSGQQAAHLVRQLLDFSRKSIHQPKQLDLVPFIKEIVKFLGRALPDNIRLNLSFEAGHYLIEADPTQLRQVITNLAINARDAMPSGGILKIGLSRRETTGDKNCATCGQPIIGEWIVLTVTDTGSGIPADILPHVFEPFYTTKEVGQGTGLGLSQVYGIITQHAGHITVESQVDQGTTFTLYLPPVTNEQLPPVATLSTGKGRWG